MDIHKLAERELNLPIDWINEYQDDYRLTRAAEWGVFFSQSLNT
jgi:hypothetical protein